MYFLPVLCAVVFKVLKNVITCLKK
jgi:hypothetical protein